MARCHRTVVVHRMVRATLVRVVGLAVGVTGPGLERVMRSLVVRLDRLGNMHAAPQNGNKQQQAQDAGHGAPLSGPLGSCERPLQYPWFAKGFRTRRSIFDGIQQEAP
jgi:hypothetical protein